VFFLLEVLQGSVTTYQITVRYGRRYQRYHTFTVDAADVSAALREAAERIPPEVLPEADLAELRVAVDPDARASLTTPG
jgi:hypothetical protein